MHSSEKNSNPIKTELMECVDENRHVKESVIAMLPENIEEILSEHIAEEKADFSEYNDGAEMSESMTKKVLRGRVFELLSYYEHAQALLGGSSEGSEAWESAQETLTVSSILCKIATYPERYGVKISKYSRIPDSVYVGINKRNNFHVYGLAEAKIGALNQRALDQLALHGSRSTMANIVEQVGGIISRDSEDMHPEIRELAEILGDRNLEIRKNEDGTPRMGMEVIIPSARHGDFFEPELLFETSRLANDYKTMQTKDNRLTEKASVFTRKDIGNITNVLFNKITQKN